MRRARRSYLATSIGKVLLLFVSSRAGHRCGCFYLGPQRAQRAKGHFKDSEVGANCIVLLSVLCLWEGGGFVHVLWSKCLRGHFGTG